jgi:hypothetical protein
MVAQSLQDRTSISVFDLDHEREAGSQTGFLIEENESVSVKVLQNRSG